MKFILIFVFVGIFVWTIWSFYAYTVETLGYSVIEKRGEYEIRSYKPYIAMQVEVGGDTQEALYSGFRILAGYIFGDNQGKQKIQMTTPVMENEKTTVAMTAPVMEQKNGERRVVTFTAPSEYTIETLPKPNTDKIKFMQIQAKKYAVHRFTWYYTTERIEAKKKYLLELLTKDKFKTLSEPIFAGYNGPGTIPFLMRNEILVEIE